MQNGKKQFEAENDEVLTAKILEFSHEYQAVDFPNSDRKECPPPEELSKIAVSGELPPVVLRQHLLSCSPCFLEFQSARKSKNVLLAANSGLAEKPFWLRYFWRPLPMLAGFFLLICALTGSVFYGLFSKSGPEIAKKIDTPLLRTERSSADQNNQPENSNPPAGKLTPVQSTPGQTNQVTNKESRNRKTRGSESESSLPTAIQLDLAKSDVLRNEASREKIYKLPPKIVTVNLKLIAGSPAGNYQISLLNESGQMILGNRTGKSDGKSLRIDLDLRNKSGRARLCVAPNGEIPDCLAVRIVQDR